MPKICVFNTISSTQTYIKDIINNGIKIPKEGFGCFSYSQISGVGKLGRKWYSPYGNVYFSFILGKKLTSFENLNYINLLIAYSLRETILKIIPNKKDDIKYKWPNDILIDGKKISGILIEIEYSKNQEMYIIVGVGINLNITPDVPNYPVTALINYSNIKINPLLFTENLYYNISKFSSLNHNVIQQNYISNLYNLNKQIKVISGNKEYCGKLKGLGVNCELILETTKGIKSITAGEIYNINI